MKGYRYRQPDGGHWLTVAQLRRGARAPDGQALYKNCCVQVESVREALERAGYDSESITHISYAQCALLDEAVMNRKPVVADPEADAGESESEGGRRTMWTKVSKPGVLHRCRPVTWFAACGRRVIRPYC
jgi:hypothetical protein